MRIKIIDGSNYFKGLLLLIRQDRKITESEKLLMKRIGKTLGFEREFCENAIHEILDNKHIPDTIPEFSSIELAKKFIKDGLSIAHSDAEVHPSEEEWLRMTAKENDVDSNWFEDECRKASVSSHLPEHLEVDSLTVTHS
ncbi:MAG: TerB family tellurite resistance protein [Ignavibacteria bacterium]|nr:TerB family tellurite resistance protein [Ignavibacteria bacterium]